MLRPRLLTPFGFTAASNEARATPGPTFGDATINDPTWFRNTAIPVPQLPEAVGGDGTLIYSLGDRPPAGITLNGTTRQLTGAPTATMATKKFTWTARDNSGNTVTLTFNITVLEGG